MLRYLFIISLAIFVSVFSSNRVSHQKAVVKSNYIKLCAVEQVNIENLLNGVSFYINSVNLPSKVMNHSPYTNSEGKKEVFIGNMINGNEFIDDVKNVNNNFLYTFDIDYNNSTKKVKVIPYLDELGDLQTTKIEVEDKYGDKVELNVFEVR